MSEIGGKKREKKKKRKNKRKSEASEVLVLFSMEKIVLVLWHDKETKSKVFYHTS